MSTEQTQKVLEHHAIALAAHDVDETMTDYTDDSVLITNIGGVVKGAEAIRAVFEAPSVLSGVERTGVHVEGEVAFITWKADGIPFGTDTFVIRDGKILVQTVALHFS